MAESITPFVSAVGAGIAAGVFSSAVIYWFGRRNIKVNMMKALDAESSRNKQIVQSNILFKKDFAESGANRRRVVFLSFHNDVWRSIINHGLFNSFDKAIIGDLVEMYSLIAELNSIISACNSQEDVCFPTIHDRNTNSSTNIERAELVDEFRRLNEKIIDLRKEMKFDEDKVQRRYSLRMRFFRLPSRHANLHSAKHHK